MERTSDRDKCCKVCMEWGGTGAGEGVEVDLVQGVFALLQEKKPVRLAE